jgi:hypothetical protein
VTLTFFPIAIIHPPVRENVWDWAAEMRPRVGKLAVVKLCLQGGGRELGEQWLRTAPYRRGESHRRLPELIGGIPPEATPHTGAERTNAGSTYTRSAGHFQPLVH